MKVMHKIEVETMAIGDVLLVSAKGKDEFTSRIMETEYKLIAESLSPSEEDCKDLAMVMYVETDNGEVLLGKYMISAISVGKPILGISMPEKDKNGILRVNAKLKTKPVERIEFYDSDIP
jgi:hypothetical protein